MSSANDYSVVPNKAVDLPVSQAMISIVDYGMGNLQSVQQALEHVGAETCLASTADEIASAEQLVLPGVGGFADAMDHLNEQSMVSALRDYASGGKPMLGVCLGMQLLFEGSDEAPGVAGLGVFAGQVKRFAGDMGLKVPHMGWNTLKVREQSRVLAGLGDEPYTYFVHSYYVVPAEEDIVAATTDYGIEFVSAVEKGAVSATQFHPEKSQDIGLKIYKNFAGLQITG